ncbi:MAG: hypothetical protein SF053_08265 [Bacteroidia bacterium]|nr:hypothetical protein [Bacteroidia bacterium]
MTARNLHILLLALSVGIVVPACNTAPVFPAEPKIEVLDIYPDVVKSLQDSIFIVFKFQDGDGNLGSEDGEINLELIDSRINNGLTREQATSQFSVPNLTPNVKRPSIQGEITVSMPFTIVIPPNTSQEVRYQVKLYDRAGNLATPIEGAESSVYTDYITVVK